MSKFSRYTANKDVCTHIKGSLNEKIMTYTFVVGKLRLKKFVHLTADFLKYFWLEKV